MALSADAAISSVGRILSWRKTSTGIAGTLASAYFSIRVYDANTIRVRVSRQEAMDEFSYLLVRGEEIDSNSIAVAETPSGLRVRTAAIILDVESEPSFRVTFRNLQGTIINEDVAGEGFGTSFTGNRVNLYKKLQPGERFVGLGEALGNLDKRGSAFTLNNTDTYRYGDPRLPMYVSIPFYIGIHQREVYGLFYHNTYPAFFNFGISTPTFSSITAEGGDADYFFIYDKSIPDILRHYTSLTGRMPLPPVWSLGYHQSRCSYFPQRAVEALADSFRARTIPVDCIVLDADYLREYEPFRIDHERFPDMPGLTGRLRRLGIEVTASVNPGIKLDSTYDAQADGLEHDIFVRYADGSLYTAEIAPSLDHFVDFTDPKGRAWWAEWMKFLPENGIHGTWNDMNEPAVGGSYLPDNLVFDFDGRKAGALEAKNLYGMLMARSSYESAMKHGMGRRPFVLTRSGFAGVQRYAAVWTGDNTASDAYLLSGTLLNCQMGLSGVPFVGDDIGGYIGKTSPELFARWIEAGMFAPFARNHKEADAPDNEPWSYGKETESIAREFIGFRYRLLPYLYSKFYETSRVGIPVARSLCIQFPFDPSVYDPRYQSEFLCGDALLVAPVASTARSGLVYLPEGEWYDLYSDSTIAGKKEFTVDCPIFRIPVYVKASSIIPTQTLVQTTKQLPSDTLTIHVYNGRETNSFVLYEDDGDSFGYQKGEYCRRTIKFDPGARRLVVSASEGTYRSHFTTITCVFHGFAGGPREVTVNGRPAKAHKVRSMLLDGLLNMEGVYKVSANAPLLASPVKAQSAVTFGNTDGEVRLSW